MKLVYATFLAICMSNFCHANELISIYDIIHDDQYDKPSWSMEKEIQNNGVKFTARFDFTAKGNGIFWISKDEWIRIFDSHNDSETYKDYLLDQEFKDIDLDKFDDLILTGIKQIWDEKGNEVIREKPVTIVLIFQPTTLSYRIAYTSEL